MANKQNIVIVNYGLGNIHSVSKALARVAPDARIKISNEPQDLDAATHVVFPGVGAIQDCIRPLHKLKLSAAIANCTQPLLGICVGMQALFGYNEENGGAQGLGIINGQVRRFQPPSVDYKVPHMGWNRVSFAAHSPLFANITSGERFYFVHSYYCAPASNDNVLATCDYAGEFTAIAQRDNFYGVQFHPEKSSSAGLQLLRNFVDL